MDDMVADSRSLMGYAAGHQLRLDQLAKQYQGYLWFVDSNLDGICSNWATRERSEKVVDTVRRANGAERNEQAGGAKRNGEPRPGGACRSPERSRRVTSLPNGPQGPIGGAFLEKSPRAGLRNWL